MLRKKTSLPINQLQSELKIFHFPQKDDFLACLEEFKKLRNQAMHNLMQLAPGESANKLDRDLERIAEIAEDVLAKYIAITAGLVAIWNSAHAQLKVTEPTVTTTTQAPEVISD